MKIVELIRLETNKVYGTLGILKVNKRVFCCTIEPPDEENRQNISSIPTGQYICQRTFSPSFGTTFQVMEVTARTSILFHKGNHEGDTAGCILLGQYFDKLSSHERAVLNSGNTFHNFMMIMENDYQFHLTIKEEY